MSTPESSYPNFVPANEEQQTFINRRTEKPLFSRKTYLMDLYKHLNDNNQILLFVHHNNLSKAENKQFRQELAKIKVAKRTENEAKLGSASASGVKLTILNNSIYRTYLRCSHEEDPAGLGVSSRNKDVHHPLAPLFVGPTGCISIPECDPSLIQQINKVLKKFSEKLFIMGAKVEKNTFMNPAELDQFKNLPTKVGLQGQLLGLLTMVGGSGLVHTLETPAHLLYLTMDTRAKDLDPNSKEAESTESS
ncbi:hypothetical protein KGF56_000492 [Candida oxycetoniae]|uniref:Uncharacterized protein n=1 Tax=Candida oxycetoniae TaxID=497107 RepID=A0AAI9T1N8_9ASCO|nr:uncharacterized protein KGF56_000492 [Candida oxycetoniae]KAI3406646.2 hypothetical protein KGF56_000492 [Candida oxycetoniae]